jgi:hypothetical protein
MAEPGTRVVSETETSRVVDGKTYRIVRLAWNDTSGLSFDVYDESGECLTDDESFDFSPTDDQIRDLLQ